MTVFKHELKQGMVSLLIWAACVAGMLGMCVLIYPEMGAQMKDVSRIFSMMGSFTAAFGMDRLNIGEFTGFFGIECGNVLGLGGAMYASLTGISVLAKEEKEHTAEFLLTHPVSRGHVLTEKLLAVFTQVILLNIVCAMTTLLCMAAIRTEADAGTIALIFTAYLIMQLELASVTFGISAFMRRGYAGVGLGLAAAMYFLNIAANLTDKAKFVKFITPFGYCECADIVSNGSMNTAYLAVGIALTAIGIAAGYRKYLRKDIA